MVGLVLAHQGGWDELLFIFSTLAVLASLIWYARLRAYRKAGAGNESTGTLTATPKQS